MLAPGAKPMIAAETARLLMDARAILFSEGEPFTFTSGMKSPVYTDMRKIIAYPRTRTRLIELAVETIEAEIGAASLDIIAGGETAGIPFAAWIADRMALPMQYIRKKPKGFGRNAQIEGELEDGARTLLVEDLATDAGSKINFISALRQAGQRCDHAFVFFFYDIFPKARQTMADLAVELHYLTTWPDVLREVRDSGYLPSPILREVEAFLGDPLPWSAAHGGITDLSPKT